VATVQFTPPSTSGTIKTDSVASLLRRAEEQLAKGSFVPSTYDIEAWAAAIEAKAASINNGSN
ncbi:MAG: hypothetical protein WA434_15260, partial [Candidatus Acidiferrales bacterium]